MDKKSLAHFHLEIMDAGERFTSLDWPLQLTPKQVKQRHKGEPILTFASPLIGPEIFFERFLEVARACLKWQPEPQAIAESLIKRVQNLSKSARLEILKSAIQGVQRTRGAEILGLSIETFDFLIKVTLKPFFTLFSKSTISHFKPADWFHGYCPVCGENPVMAKLDGESGQRKLYCGLCETEWHYYRIGCPFCGNQDPNHLSFFAAGDVEQYRVYLCDQCRSYLKTVDERKCGEVDLFCEDIATVDLDRLALEEGYNRPGNRCQA